MSNVLRIDGRARIPAFVSESARRSQIEVLEEALRDARAGKVRALSLVQFREGGGTTTTYVHGGADDRIGLAIALQEGLHHVLSRPPAGA